MECLKTKYFLILLSCFIFLLSVPLAFAQLTASQMNNLANYDVSKKSSSLERQRKPIFLLKSVDWEESVHVPFGKIA